MARFGLIALALLVVGLVAAAPAQSASMVFIKKSNVWMSRVDGSGQVRVTKDGSRGNPYYSPSIADNGTIVALKSVFLHSFRPNGRRIVRAAPVGGRPVAQPVDRAVLRRPLPERPDRGDPERRLLDVLRPAQVGDPSHGVRLVHRLLRLSEEPPKEIGLTDGFYDYNYPAWIDSSRVLSTSYGIFNAQIFTNRVGQRTRGVEFYRDPGRDPDTGTNSYILADAELTRTRNRFATMRRPLRADTADLSVGTIQIYRTLKPSTASEPLCAIGPGRKIGSEPDPSWSPDGKTLVWYENGRGIHSSPVTSAPGCGLRPRLIVRGAHSPDLSKAKVPRRRRG